MDRTPVLYADSFKKQANTICDVIDCTEEEKNKQVPKKFQRYDFHPFGNTP